jgi:hypothetical protein
MGVLSARALLDKNHLIEALVNKDPGAGVDRALPPVLSAEEELAALEREGWKFVAPVVSGGKGYWLRSGSYRPPYQTEKPSLMALTSAELLDLGVASAGPRDFLLVNLALLSEDSSVQVTAALLRAVERGVAMSGEASHRTACLERLLSCDDDGRRLARVALARSMLEGRLQDFRDGSDPSLAALKNYALCSRVEVLVATLQRLRDAVPEMAAEAASLDWAAAWLEDRRPRLRVTLEQLQGVWTNGQGQEIRVTGNLCSFGGEPVTISMDHTGLTYLVPGWSLLQQDDASGCVTWVSNTSREQTMWSRGAAAVVTTATVVTNNNSIIEEDEDDEITALYTTDNTIHPDNVNSL